MKKVKRTRLLLVLTVVIPLLVLQFSCATIEKKKAEEVPAEKAIEMPKEAGFSNVEVKQLPHDPINYFYVARS